MKLSDPVQFEHDNRRELYEMIEQRGGVRRDDLMRGDVNRQRGIGHDIAILKRNGYVEEDEDGELSIAIDTEDETDFESDGIEFTIRQARQKDLTGIVGVMRQVTEEKTYIVAETVAAVLDHENVLIRHNRLESRIFFVATVNDDVVGWVHLKIPELEKLGHTTELTVGVLEEYRGHGIGSRLLETGLEWAAENDLDKVYQSIPSTNDDAIEFIEARGGEIEAVREDHYKIAGEYLDEVMMAIRL